MDPFSFLERQSICESPIWPVNNHFGTHLQSSYSELDELGPYFSNDGHLDTSPGLFDLPIDQVFRSSESRKTKQLSSESQKLSASRVLTYDDAGLEHVEHKSETINRKSSKNTIDFLKDYNKPKTKAQLSGKTANDRMKGFAQLVNKASSFWMDKFRSQSSTGFSRNLEKDLLKNTKNKYAKQTMIAKEPWDSDSDVFVCQEQDKENCIEMSDFVRMQAQEVKVDQENYGKVIEKKIKKVPKHLYENGAKFSKQIFTKKQHGISQTKSVEEDVVDSYFNKDDMENPGKSLLENNHVLFERKENSSNMCMQTRRLEEDIFQKKPWEERPKKEAIEILNGRISLLTSLYNQTKLEITRMQQNRKQA